MNVNVFARGNDYYVLTPYNRDFVDNLKTLVPYSARKYNPTSKAWLVAGTYGDVIERLIKDHFGVAIQLPAIGAIEPLTNILEIIYVGKAKTRSDGSITASGWHQSGWNVMFTLESLKGYFEPNITKDRPTSKNLYHLLGITQAAGADEIKAGYRRMVKQWHPDVYHEPDAVEVFLQIQHAWEILSNDKLRARYAAGLALEATLNKRQASQAVSDDDYRAPLRSGLVLVTYTEQASMKIISKIHSWADIKNAAGQTLVSSWVMGEDAPRMEWV